MSVSYVPTKISVPNGFETLLADLTKQILAEQPEDLIGFAATYINGKLHHMKGTSVDCSIFASFPCMRLLNEV